MYQELPGTPLLNLFDTILSIDGKPEGIAEMLVARLNQLLPALPTTDAKVATKRQFWDRDGEALCRLLRLNTQRRRWMQAEIKPLAMGTADAHISLVISMIFKTKRQVAAMPEWHVHVTHLQWRRINEVSSVSLPHFVQPPRAGKQPVCLLSTNNTLETKFNSHKISVMAWCSKIWTGGWRYCEILLTG